MGILASTMVHPEEALVISFDEGGSAESLHIDTFDLGFLGNKAITRATDIAFDDGVQAWSIYLLDKTGGRLPLVHGSTGLPSYELARKVEVGWLNLCRLNEVSPESDHGHVFLNQMRKTLGLPL